MNSDHLRQALTESTACLDRGVAQDWSVTIPGMTWSIGESTAHISSTILWFAADSLSGPVELSTMDLSVRADSSPTDLVRTVASFGAVLAATIDAMGPGVRGFHPAGVSDASGFAAMGCDEVLVHTYDAATALGLEFEPSAEPCSLVVARIFPWAPDDEDPWQTLLWANGRVALGARPRQEKWKWFCAPLSEWDGLPR